MKQKKNKATGINFIALLLLLSVFIVPLMSASISDSIYNYYKSDETSGTILIDANNTKNGTIGTGVILNEAGILGSSHLWYNNSNKSFAELPSMTTYSVSFWVKSNATTTINLFRTTNFSITSNGQVGVGSLSPNNWNFIAIAIKPSPTYSFASAITVWVNGVKTYETLIGWSCYDTVANNHNVKSVNWNLAQSGNSLNLYRMVYPQSDCASQKFGGFHTLNMGTETANNQSVQIDEIGMFKDYFFSSDDVTYLFNSGNARTFSQLSQTVPLRFVDFEDTFVSNFIAYSINGHYSNYDSFNVSWFDETLNQTVNMSRFINQSAISISGDIKVTLDGQINPNDILFKVESLNKNRVTNFTVYAINSNGFDVQSFSITTSEIAGAEFSFTRTFLSGFTTFFPDKELLTSAERFAFALIVIIASVVAILIVGKESIELALVLASIISILEFIYFVFIGYIGIGVVILLVLLGVILTYFKFRRG